MAVEEWGPLSRRTDVRLAMFTGSISVLLVIAGSITLVLMRDLNAIGVGALGLWYCYTVLWPLRARWTAWRAIGGVALEMTDLNIVPGELTTCTVRIDPRHEGVVREASLVFGYRDSRSGPAPGAWQIDVPLTDAQLRPGTPWSATADVMLPPGVPPSFFDSRHTRQWSVTGIVELTDGRRWQREYAVMVYPTP
jgi:hypothetical protein